MIADNVRPWKEVQQAVAQLIRDKIIVGHTLWQDLSGEPIRTLVSNTDHFFLMQLPCPYQFSGSAILLWPREMSRFTSPSATPFDHPITSLVFRPLCGI